MIKQDVDPSDLRQPSDQIKYVKALNGIQEELCSVIESQGILVTPSKMNPWNQLTTLLEALQCRTKSFHLHLSRGENESYKNTVIRLDSLSLLHPKTISASFLLRAVFVDRETGRIFSPTDRYSVLYSHRINRWYFPCLNPLDHTTSAPLYDSLDITPVGFLLNRCSHVFFKGRKIGCNPIGSQMKESRFFFDDSGSPCIALAPPDEFYLKSISILDWRRIV